ncbi:hypothetical protein ACFYV5_10955 [Streptomyces sp. NPDC003035]
MLPSAGSPIARETSRNRDVVQQLIETRTDRTYRSIGKEARYRGAS